MDTLTVTRPRRRVEAETANGNGRARSRGSGRRRASRIDRALRSSPASASDRERLAAAIARRGVRERLVLALLLYERLHSAEVADALGVSPRQVVRTYQALVARLRRSFARASRARAAVSSARLRRAA